MSQHSSDQLFSFHCTLIQLYEAEGEIYAWGLGTSYQLGTGVKHETKIPMKVFTPPGIVWKDIATGYYHSVAFGSNQYARIPTRSEAPFKAQMIACGLYHTSVIDGTT
jgi:alpha-tubulin suppressor-like RCC1 family protein